MIQVFENRFFVHIQLSNFFMTEGIAITGTVGNLYTDLSHMATLVSRSQTMATPFTKSLFIYLAFDVKHSRFQVIEVLIQLWGPNPIN